MKKRNIYIALAIVAQLGIGAFVAQSVMAARSTGTTTSTGQTVNGSGLTSTAGRNPDGSVVNIVPGGFKP